MAALTSPHKQNTRIVQYCSRNQKATPAAVPKVPVQTTTTGNANSRAISTESSLHLFPKQFKQSIPFFFWQRCCRCTSAVKGSSSSPWPPPVLRGLSQEHSSWLLFFFKATERSPLGCLKRQINSCSDNTSAVCSCHGCTPVTNKMLRKGLAIKSSGADSFRPRLIQYLSEDLWAYLSQGGISYFCSFMEN